MTKRKQKHQLLVNFNFFLNEARKRRIKGTSNKIKNHAHKL